MLLVNVIVISVLSRHVLIVMSCVFVFDHVCFICLSLLLRHVLSPPGCRAGGSGDARGPPLEGTKGTLGKGTVQKIGMRCVSVCVKSRLSSACVREGHG